MTIAELLAGTPLPRADAEVLLAHVLGKNRAWLIAHTSEALTPEEWQRYAVLTARRRAHEPVSQIVGSVEFYGRRFAVNRDVLTPRPSTEGVVRGALAFLDGDQNGIESVDEGIAVLRSGSPVVSSVELSTRVQTGNVRTIVDIGTGSGCIAITLKLEQPDLRLIATDISANAIAVAKKNAEMLNAQIDFRLGSLLDPINDLTEPFLLVSNPPYISDDAVLMKDVVDYEPHVALFGGKHGGDIVRNILSQARAHPLCCGYVIECMERMANDGSQIIKED